MKTLIVLIGGICLLSTSVNAQSADKNNVKVEKLNVVLAKKTPVKLKTYQPTSSKTTSIKQEEKHTIKETIAIKPKK